MSEIEQQLGQQINDITKQTKNENIESLKVSADEDTVSSEERKRRAKKLAGAISHGIRNRGEIKVRAFGDGAAWKSVKSLAIARKYIAATNPRMELSYSPAFIDAEIAGGTMGGVGFSVFASERAENVAPVDIDKVKVVLLVRRDPDDASIEAKKESIRKLAGAITHACLENGECVVRAFGQYCLYKTCKALAMARGFTASKGPDLYVWNDFAMADMNGSQQTGFSFYVFTNEIR